MTYYFDSIQDLIRTQEEKMRRICAGLEDGPDDYEQYPDRVVERAEKKLILDVQLVASFPDFPGDLRRAVHAAVARHATEPFGLAITGVGLAADEDDLAVFRRVSYLANDLHDVFHAVGRSLGPRPSAPRRLWRALCAAVRSFRATWAWPCYSDKPDGIVAARTNWVEDDRIAWMRRQPEHAAAVAAYDAWRAKLDAEPAS